MLKLHEKFHNVLLSVALVLLGMRLPFAGCAFGQEYILSASTEADTFLVRERVGLVVDICGVSDCAESVDVAFHSGGRVLGDELLDVEVTDAQGTKYANNLKYFVTTPSGEPAWAGPPQETVSAYCNLAEVYGVRREPTWEAYLPAGDYTAQAHLRYRTKSKTGGKSVASAPLVRFHVKTPSGIDSMALLLFDSALAKRWQRKGALDLAGWKEAYTQFRRLIQAYPSSPYARLARIMIIGLDMDLLNHGMKMAGASHLDLWRDLLSHYPNDLWMWRRLQVYEGRFHSNQIPARHCWLSSSTRTRGRAWPSKVPSCWRKTGSSVGT